MPQRPPSDLKRVTAQYHAAVQSLQDNALADLQGRWQGVQATLDLKIKRLTDAIAAAQAKGETVNVAWLTQAQRLEQLRQAVQGDVSAFADGAADIVANAMSGAADLGQAAAQAALAATVPPGVNYTFGVPPSDVTERLAGALQPGSPLNALFGQMGSTVAAFAQQALFTGVALGEGPRQIARRLTWATNMAPRRAEVIARTETLRSWRHAQFANYQANRDVVQQWMWAADFGPRCCFPAGTLVQTRRGLISIEQVRVGDEALTHAGRYRRVTETLRREYDGELVTIETGAGSLVTATADHAFLAFPDSQELRLDWIGAAYLLPAQTVGFYRAETDAFGLATLAHLETAKAVGLEVFNLEVEDDHSYVANGFVVHNCGACIAMDGTFHSVDTELDDHICGRCSAIPITRSWADILADGGMSQAEIDALGLTETSGMAWAQSRESGESWLRRQSVEIQNQILGPAKAEAWRQGAFGERGLRAVVGVVHDPQWGSSIRELSLKQMGIDAQTWLQAARAAGNGSVLADEAALQAAHAETSLTVAAEQRVAQNAEAKAAADEWYAQIQRSIAAGQAGGLTSAEAKAAADEWFASVKDQLRPGGLSVEDVARAMEQRLGLAANTAAEAETAAAGEAEAANAAIRDATFSIERASYQQLEAESQRALDAIHPAEQTIVEAKRQVAAALSQRLAEHPDFAALSQQWADAVAQSFRDAGYEESIALDAASAVPTTPEDMARLLVHIWASTGSPLYPLMQDAVRAEFGLGEAMDLPATAALAEARARYGVMQPGLQAFVREMYTQTQDWLAAHDITELPLYRGMGFETLPDGLPVALFDGAPHEIQMGLRAASSFSVDVNQASKFAQMPVGGVKVVNYEQTLAARVPSELILSTPQTGFGALNEFEAVVLGGQYDVISLGIDNSAVLAEAEKLHITPEQAFDLLVKRRNEERAP